MSNTNTNAHVSVRILNGWQRLWVVAVVLFGVMSATILATNWPRRANLAEEHAIYAVELGLKVTAARAATSGNKRDELSVLRALEKGPSAIRRETYGDLSSEELLEKLKSVLKDAPELQALEQRRAKGLAALTETRRSYVFDTITIWLGSSAVLYLIGWAVGWVRRGFQ